MKKAGKISLIILVSILIIGLVVLYIYRNPFVSYALRKAIASRSNEKITLTLEKVEFDPLEGSISLYQPYLSFKEVYLNNDKAMQVNQLSFEKLGIYEVSVFDLLFKKEFAADKILLSKPAVQFEKMVGTTQGGRRFTPEKLIALLNTNSKTFTNVKLKINEVRIDFGTIHLQMDTVSKYMPDLLDFTLLLEKFETQIDPDRSTKNRILYSDDVILRVKNIAKQLESGYDLLIDSVSYSSKSERFSSNGLQLLPVWEKNESKNKIRLFIPLLKLDGFSVSEIRGLEKLHLRAIKISDASIIHYAFDEKNTLQKNVADTIQPASLPKLLKDVGVDSLIINHFTFYNVLKRSDTSIVANNINLLIKDITFDSTLIEAHGKSLQLGNILLTTDDLKLFESEKGFSFGYADFSYSSKNKLLSARSVQLFSDSLIFKGPQFNINLPTLQIGNFSVQDFIQKKKQVLSLGFEQPDIFIDFKQEETQYTKTTTKKNELQDLIVFQNFSITNGRARLRKGSKFDLALTGINLLTKGLNITDKDSSKQFIYDTLHLDIDGVEATLAEGSTRLKTSTVLLNKQYFEIDKLQTNFHRIVDNKEVNGTLTLQKMEVSEIDLNSLLFDKQFRAASIVVQAPTVNGTFLLPNTLQTDREDSSKSKIQLPIGIQIGEFRLQQGKVNVTLKKPSDTIYLQTNIDLQLGKIVSSDSSMTSWIDPVDWEVKLSTLALTSVAYDLDAERIHFSPRQSDFSLKALNLLSKPHPKHSKNKFELEQITLPKITLTGLDYALLFKHDSIHFSKLFIDQPILSLKLFGPKNEKQDENPPSTFPVEKLLGIVYDTIDLNGLHLNLEKSSDSSHELIRVGNFSIEHFFNKKIGTNLMREISFQLEEVSVVDSINKTSLHLCDLNFDPKRLTLDIHNVDWTKTDSRMNNKLDIHSSEIIFSGSYIKEALPSNVKFNKLSVSGLDIIVSDNKDKESQRKKELEFNIKVLKKYAGLLNRFSIDTTVLDDVSVNYRTFDGLEMHSIQADSIGLVVNRIHVDTSMFDQKNPVLINNIIVDLRGRTRISKDSLYDIQTGRIHYNFPEHRITVDSFNVIPRFSEEECFRRAKYQKGIINLYAEKIDFNGLRLDELLNNKQLHFGGIDVHKLKFRIVKDKKYPIKPGTYKPMPQDMIRGITQKIKIDSLRVLDSYLYFKLYPEKKTNKPGEILLTDMNASIYNITNIFDKTDSTTLRVLLNAKIMGESRMDGDFYFPLQDTANHWWFSFKTEKIDFTKLNSMTQHLVGLTILRGKGSVNAPLIHGDNFNATGTMIFRYKKVRLSLYNRKKAETETGIFNSMANFLINDLVIKSNNPKFARKPKVGIVYAQRDTQKSIVNYAFKSILSGMLSTLGINKKEQRKERREYKKEEKQSTWKSF